MNPYKQLLFIALFSAIIIVGCSKSSDSNDPNSLDNEKETDFFVFFAEFQDDLKNNKGLGIDKYYPNDFFDSLVEFALWDPYAEAQFLWYLETEYEIVCQLSADNNYSLNFWKIEDMHYEQGHYHLEYCIRDHPDDEIGWYSCNCTFAWIEGKWKIINFDTHN